MKAEGFARFGMKQHTDLWKSKDARNPKYHLALPWKARGSGMKTGLPKYESIVWQMQRS
jgi:hypothetical protein